METKINNEVTTSPRLFIAAWPDKGMITAFSKYISACNALLQGTRWTDAANLHCTLAYLGSEQGVSPETIFERIKKALEYIGPFSLRWSGPGTFLKRDTTVIWMGLEDSPPLLEVAAHIRDEFQDIMEDRAFKPHITFGRTRKLVKQPVSKYLPAWKPVSCTVDKIDLVSSELTSNGPKYSILHSIRLGVDW